MEISKQLLFSVFCICLIGLVSASGLVIENTTQLDIIKNFETDRVITLNITNEEGFDFYDIQFNKYLESDLFNLSSGESKEVDFTITQDIDISEEIKLYGYYETTLSPSNDVYYVNINYPNGFDVCDMNLIAGDTINWYNNATGNIKLRNAETGESFADIEAGSNYTETFTEAINFNYYSTRLGMQFGNVCNINVMPTSGLVHDTDYDTKINFNLEIEYEETTMQVEVPTTDYSLEYNEEFDSFLI